MPLKAQIWFDGSLATRFSKTSLAPLCLGAVVELPGGRQFCLAEALGVGTSTDAEYLALLRALQLALALGVTEAQIFGDCRHVVEHVVGNNPCVRPRDICCRLLVRSLLRRFSSWHITWLPRAYNDRADTLAGYAYRGLVPGLPQDCGSPEWLPLDLVRRVLMVDPGVATNLPQSPAPPAPLIQPIAPRPCAWLSVPTGPGRTPHPPKKGLPPCFFAV